MSVSQYTITELFHKAVDQGRIMARAPHLPANKEPYFSELIDAIVSYHEAGNDAATTRAILMAADTGVDAKASVDALTV